MSVINHHPIGPVRLMLYYRGRTISRGRHLDNSETEEVSNYLLKVLAEADRQVVVFASTLQVIVGVILSCRDGAGESLNSSFLVVRMASRDLRSSHLNDRFLYLPEMELESCTKGVERQAPSASLPSHSKGLPGDMSTAIPEKS